MADTRRMQSETPSRRRQWGMFMVVVGCLSVSGCDLEPSSARGVQAGLATLHDDEQPKCLHEMGPPQSDAEAKALRDELHRAKRVAELNHEALGKLRRDKRWAEPALHEGLESAVADTMEIIEHYEAEAECLEAALEPTER